MTSQTSKFTVIHVTDKVIQRAFKSYDLPEGHEHKIDRQTYVKIVSAVMFKSDLKNGYIKI